MVLRWIPWRYLVTRIARAYGFMDPIRFLAKLRGFAQPSEVSEPIELLRAGVLFHARGLINTKAIQHNLDWVWPYWVERQFNPADHSFIPRAFSFSHINLTHRNWTAVGLPDVPFYPIVDPRGLVTPLFDGWSLDFWIINQDSPWLLPSKLDHAEQWLETGEQLLLHTRCRQGDGQLHSRVWMDMTDQHPQCVIRIEAHLPASSRLAVVLRPYNPEGVSFVESIALSEDQRAWRVNAMDEVQFDRPPHASLFSSYHQGDVLHALPHGKSSNRIHCPVSMATGAAVFGADTLDASPLELRVPISNELKSGQQPVCPRPSPWPEARATLSRLQIPDSHWQSLFDTAIHTLLLHCPEEVYPGPYTYKRFWFRDAAFILNALITLGGRERTRRALAQFPQRQTRSGYFLSQKGEWDANGEAIWIWHRYHQLTGETLPDAWLKAIRKGADWIRKKRLPRDPPVPHAGLLPAGFSAEHLGPNDYYYWDNFWGIAGLQGAADLLQSREYADEAVEYLKTVVASFEHIPNFHRHQAVSASPYRRMDSGAVGSLVADYPLGLFPAADKRLLNTVEYLLQQSFFAGGFFQNMIHSGINAYLTLHLAQFLLRAGDPRAWQLIDAVASLASPTGQWPEAIHPQTFGGCMGDGQHVWAAAEWALMLRNLFVREEHNRLVIGSGLKPQWLRSGQPLGFGPTLTPFGSVTIRLQPLSERRILLTVEGDWRHHRPPMEVQVPGFVTEETTEHGDLSLIRVEA